jgi:hypothetical protein
VQKADGGGAQFQSVSGLAVIASGGEKGGNIAAGGGGQGRGVFVVGMAASEPARVARIPVRELGVLSG